jgi:hypothetical protein
MFVYRVLKQWYLKKGPPAASVTFQANDRVWQLQNYNKRNYIFWSRKLHQMGQNVLVSSQKK